MKLIGSLAHVLCMIRGDGQPFVTRANVSAIGYVPGTPGSVPQFRVATLDTPEARKKGCLEGLKFGRFTLKTPDGKITDYMMIKHHRGIPSVVVGYEFLAIGSELFQNEPGSFLLSAMVHQDPDATCSLLVNHDQTGWRHFPVAFISDFHVNARGRVAVMADGCVGFVDMDDFLPEVHSRAKVKPAQQAVYKIPWGRRVGVTDGTILTRYILREDPDKDTIAVCRQGVVSVFNEFGKLIRRIGDDAVRDLAVIQSERSHGVRHTVVMTDEQGIPHRLDLMELAEVDTEEKVMSPPRRFDPNNLPSPQPKREVRRVRSAISEVATEIHAATPASITH